MNKPLFDFDLKRVSHQHYITGKAAINFPLFREQHRGMAFPFLF